MMQQADQVIILADHTKIGVTGYFRFATLQDIDLFITDKEPDEKFRRLLEKHGVELLITNHPLEGGK
jgi:DeoR family transcriptional regulator, carbon catabolite repression regulator